MRSRTSYARLRPARKRGATTLVGIVAIPLLLLATAAGVMVLRQGPHAAHAAALTGLKVQGNHLQDGAGHQVLLRGVNRSGTEYACIQGWGIFDGPSDAASVQAIANWGANVVRIPLNEDCWLGINGVPSQYSGQNYINAITSFVNLLHQNGMYAELSLIWGAPGTSRATSQPAAPDEDHSPAFWASLASTFKSDSNVVLAPWGETTVSWPCFQSGGSCGGTGYAVAGMQQAVTVMRGAGYTGVIAIPCVDYANDCNDNASEWGGQNGGGDWLSHEPSDPDHQLIAEAHVYGKNTCDTAQCLSDTMTMIGTVPLIFGETGETYDGSDCNNSSSYVSSFMTWADAHGVGYEAWTWDTWGSCNLALITNYNGTPYGVYGTYVKTHLLSFGSSGTPTPTLPPSPTATQTPPGGGSSGLIAMGFAIGYSMPTTPPWGDINEVNLMALQTTKGTALDTHLLANDNVPAFTAAAHAHGVKAFITIGGSSDQDWQYACTGSNQAGFVQNLVKYMQSNGFDGIDLDIEDGLWGSQGPPSPDMTACIEAISKAAKAVKTTAGNVPLISADVITNWEGWWFAPSQAYVDQFNLMTYGDTIAAGNYQADVQDTIKQGLPKNKLVGGIDVIDHPATDNQCGPFEQYAQQNGLAGAFVWDESTDETKGYPCFNQFAAYLGGGSGGTPTPTPSPSPTGTPTITPSPSPSPTPPGTCTAPTIDFGAQSANPPSLVAAGQPINFTTSFTASCATTGLVDFQVFTASGKRIWETWQGNRQLTGQSQTFKMMWRVPASQAPGGYYLSIGVFSPDWSQLWAWKHQAVIFSVTSAAQPCTGTNEPTIRFTGASATPNPASPGTSVRLGVTFIASCAIVGLVDYAVYDGSGRLVYQTWLDNRWLSGQQQSFAVSWHVRSGQARGTYHLSLGVFSPASTGWRALYGWDQAATPLSIT